MKKMERRSADSWRATSADRKVSCKVVEFAIVSVQAIEAAKVLAEGAVSPGQRSAEPDAVYLAFFRGEITAWNFPRSGSLKQWKN